MQELMDKVQSINERYELKGDANWLMNEIIDHIDKSLEKEKEQIIEAYCNGDDNISAEEYYNQTYNQNK